MVCVLLMNDCVVDVSNAQMLELVLIVLVCVVCCISRLTHLQPWICKESVEFARLEEVLLY